MAGVRPESALKSAQDFVAIGDVTNAMNTLEEFLHFRRRAKEWSPEYERLMLYLVRLCVDQRESRCVREGLFSFRSITTNVGEPEPLRKAIKLWHDLTLAKVAEARSLCSSAEAPVRDLDAERSPEETIMSAVSEAGESERRERDVLIPWVRYACDTIKQALSLLRADNKVVEGMETLYHEIAVRSFRFLREIGRTNEFRQLSKTLREHLEDLLRDPPRGETPDAQARLQDAFVRALEAHLQTRFSQLDHCDELGIWAEALRVAEDMERILFHPEFERKHTNLASYYDRLARIFLASENPLLHACAFFQHVLNVPRGPVADRRRLATTTVLAALSAPVFSEDVVDGDDAPRTRRSRLVDMLHITWTPSRATLLAETEAHGYLAFADPEVQALHNLLEKKFEPLRLIEEAQPLLAWVQTAYDGQLARYAKAVQRLLVLRLVSQLSSVYTTVRLSKFFTMVESLSLGPYEIEREIVSAVRARHLRVRIDHKNDSLHLGDDSFESSESMRRQLAHLANRLRHVVALLAQSGTPEAAAADPTIAEAARRRADTFAAARASIGPLHDGMLRRVAFIEADREEEERRRIKERQEEEERRKKETEERNKRRMELLEAERRQREKEKQEELERAKLTKQIATLKSAAGERGSVAVELTDLSKLEEEKRKAEVAAAEADRRKRSDFVRRLRERTRRLEFINLLIREHEAPRIEALEARLAREEREHHRSLSTQLTRATQEAWRAKHEEKTRFAAALPLHAGFEATLLARRRAAHDADWARRVEEARRNHYTSQIARARDAARRAAAERARELEREAAQAREMARLREEQAGREAEQRRRQELESRSMGRDSAGAPAITPGLRSEGPTRADSASSWRSAAATPPTAPFARSGSGRSEEDTSASSPGTTAAAGWRTASGSSAPAGEGAARSPGAYVVRARREGSAPSSGSSGSSGSSSGGGWR